MGSDILKKSVALFLNEEVHRLCYRKLFTNIDSG